MKLIVYTDGASRGNPGPASYGFTISDDKGQFLHQQGRYIGRTTNNVAEYTGVLEALKFINRKYKTKKPHEVSLYADSKLVAEQLSGRYKIKNAKLKLIFDQIKILEFDLGTVFYTHVYRHRNIKADKLANEVLDNR